MHRIHPRINVAVVLVALASALVTAQGPSLGKPEQIADGVLLYRLDDPALLTSPAPIAVQALRLDPARVSLEVGLAGDGEPARAGVLEIAARRGAIAAVNAGFFALADGRPSALLKKDGEVVGGTTRPRGAVAILEQKGRTHLLFDRVTGGKSGYRTRLGTSPQEWARARHAVSGAGLLVLDGRQIDDWTEERIAAGFDTARHPRTIIGVDGAGAIWLVTVDGRNPQLSVGMSFTELQTLSRRLGLRAALNLDGGGSTTMVAGGRIVNTPSDPAGPRKVSDALLVVPIGASHR